ncbi:AAA family ATPase [Prevotella sp. RM4]|uniref:AAA family ATPase n=1 Tax=Prevotella sp. RM4 TaxID=1200547 RepID=UPI00051B1F40|nr:AAA family ATPase [Prevotella sp. RM4]
MFKIIAIETIPAPAEYAQGYPDIPEELSPLDIKIAKAKKERYDSTMRILKAEGGLNRRYVFCREYTFDRDGKLKKGESLLPEGFYNQIREEIVDRQGNTREIKVNICAIVGKNGSGKSSLLELMLRLLNNTAYALKEGIDNNGSYDLHFVDGIFARLYLERPDGKLIRIEQEDAKITLSYVTEGTIVWRYNNRERKNRDTEEAARWQRECKCQLEFLFYTIMVDYSAYGFNIDDYRAEWINQNEENIRAEEQRRTEAELHLQEETQHPVLKGRGSDEERCWIGSLFHKNDAYQTPIVINPFRTRGNIDYNRERGLLNERLFLLLMDNTEAISGILGNKEPYSFIFSKQEEYLPASNIDCKFSCKKVNDALEEYQYYYANYDENGNIINYQRGVRGDNNEEKNRILEEISERIINYWQKCLGFRLVENIDALNVDVKRYQDKISALNYVVYKTIKCAHYYSQYHAYKGSIGSGIRLDEYIKRLFCDDTHITLKLRRALAQLIFGHYGTEMYINAGGETSEIILQTFKNRLNDKLQHCAQVLSNRRDRMPVDDPFSDEDFTQLGLTRKTEWKKEELLPSPSLFTSLILQLSDGNFILFDTLSSGEKQMIYTLGTTVYQLHHLNSVDASKIQYPCVNIIFDEIELYYHPDYQKELVNRMLNVIGNMTLGTVEHINMIFATHSPFILSDIPKDHILYLKNGSDVSVEVEVNPFGANINDVLRSSFFLEDGFMGDFVSKNLLELIDYMEKKNDSTKWKQTAEQVIKAVGDPFLKARLTDLFQEYKRNKRSDDTVAC